MKAAADDFSNAQSDYLFYDYSFGHKLSLDCKMSITLYQEKEETQIFIVETLRRFPVLNEEKHLYLISLFLLPYNDVCIFTSPDLSLLLLLSRSYKQYPGEQIWQSTNHYPRRLSRGVRSGGSLLL